MGKISLTFSYHYAYACIFTYKIYNFGILICLCKISVRDVGKKSIKYMIIRMNKL